MITLLGLLVLEVTFLGAAHTAIDPDSVVGLWLLDEGKGKEAKDISGNGLHGFFTGKPKWREGKFGKALEFGGFGDTVEIEDFAMEFPTEEVTLTSWVQVEGFRNQDLFSLVPLEPGRVTVHMPWDNGVHWQFGTPFKGTNPVPLGNEVKGEWEHWAFVNSKADPGMIVYRGGEEVRRIGGFGEYAPRAGSFHIGGRLGSSFEGFIDEVGLFQAALSHEDIKHIMDQGLEGGIFSVSATGRISTFWGLIKGRRE